MSSVHSIDQDLLHSISIRKWSTLASWAVLLYEYIITFNEEIRYIWSFPVTAVHLIYVLSRYFAIIVQSINVFLILRPFSALDIPEQSCRRWFLFELIAVCVLMAALDSILMLRVYALHRKDRRIGVLLVTLFLGQIVVEVVCGQRALNVPFNRICDANRTHGSVVYYCISVWVMHISLVVLTACKYDLMKMKIPIVRVVTRDGAWITVIVCSLFTTIAPWTLIHQAPKAHIVFGCVLVIAADVGPLGRSRSPPFALHARRWPISIISVSCCRMIMNMQSLDITEARVDPENLTELTSFIELQTLQLELKGQ
ncbi:hypothetical protein CVT25_007225 [Psilocybe cyanescens]|uniref:DUF6533 domain-containing protein n=1 Tax=Psilocybe cyanescens TaxID=93625 RepID=A0A409XVS4_PSICY|nr:hypothetical protein CVT25_007225 [Psilocybe cyanescens]